MSTASQFPPVHSGQVLIDTSVWSLVLRRKPANLNPAEVAMAEAVFRLISSGQARMIGVVRQELLSGLREQTEFERLRTYLRSFEEPRLEIEDYEEAARMFNRCRRQGIASSAIDLQLCAVAKRRAWSIFTLDQDFDRYRRTLGISLYRLP